jgi:hypothetical protein
VKKHVAAAIMLAGMSIACGKSGSFTGTVSGKGLSVADAIFFEMASTGTTPATDTAFIVLSSTANACDDVTNSKQRKGLTIMALNVTAIDPNSSTVAITTGTYDATSQTKQAGGLFEATDTSCNATVTAPVTAGTVTLTAFSKTQAEGDFNLTLGSDTVSGHFSAAQCAGLASAISQSSSSNTATCVD